MRNKRMWLTVVSAVVLLAIVTSLGPVAREASAFDLGGGIGTLVKVFGIVWVVDRFSGQIDDFINRFLAQNDAPLVGKSAVVPVIRVAGGIGGTAVGAAQVVGPPQQVDKVQAVAEIQLSISRFRGRALIPVTTRKNLTSSIKGVGGVGISAEIKFPL